MMLVANILTNPDSLRILAASASVGVAGAVLSVFVILRRWAYLGDGIAHAAFGGIGTAVLLAIPFPALNDGPPIFMIGAAFAIATAVAVAAISRKNAVTGDAAVGIFVAAALAWGFIAFAIHDHLGRGGTAGWESYLLGSAIRLTPAAAGLAAGLCIAILVVVVALRRQIMLYCFDPTLAQVTGIPVGFIHYLLILLVALVIIAGMRLAGNLLVPALLVLPGAAGLAFSRNIKTVLAIAVFSNLIATLAGIAISAQWRFIPPGPSIVAVLFVEFLAVYFIRPRAASNV